MRASNGPGPTVTVTYLTKGALELHLVFPAKFEVCPRCKGRGKHVNPAIDGNGISAEEFEEDPEFADAYMAGVYDVTCHECGGDRVVAVIDEKRLDRRLRWRYDLWYRQREAFEREAAEDRRTQFWENGGRWD